MGLVGGNFLIVLDVSILNVALVDIRDDLHASTAVMPWVVDAYTVVFAGMLLVAGSVADRFGPRRVYLASMVLFAGFSVVCAFAPSAQVLVGGRALQGVAAAGLGPASLALLAAHFPDPAERSRVIGVWAAMSSVGFALGPVVGGSLVEVSGWRLIFLINPLVVAAVVLLGVGLDGARPDTYRQFDLAGLLLSVCCLGSVTFAIIHAGSFGWRSAESVWSFGVGIVSLALLLVVERRSACPALPAELVTSPGIAADMAAVVAAAFAFYGSLFGLTIWMVEKQGMSPLHTGVAFLPMTLPMCVLPFITGRLVTRYGTRRVILAGLVVSLFGAVGLVFAEPNPSYGIAVALGTLLAIGATLTIPATTTDISIVSAKAIAATAQGAQGAARKTGVVLGIAAMASASSLRGVGSLAVTVLAAGIATVLYIWGRDIHSKKLATRPVYVSALPDGARKTRRKPAGRAAGRGRSRAPVDTIHWGAPPSTLGIAGDPWYRIEQ
ncbi:MFS transporter [Nocardia takedensis]|uniref:MFS transporter n=1 Tax=Nocardia takedensis TaxID=259390 RepID=UPI003F75D5F3